MKTDDRYLNETVSHSGLMSLEKGPRTYRSYKNREQGSTVNQDLGTAIHCNILEPDELKLRYCISSFEIPSGKNAIFVEELFKTRPTGTDVFDSIIDIEQTSYREIWVTSAHLKSDLKNTPEKAWSIFKAKTKAGEKLRQYWDFLEESEGKLKLSPSDMETLYLTKRQIRAHKKANSLLFGTDESYNELDIIWKKDDFKFKMRSIVDRLVINRDKKEVYVIDLKTSSSNVHWFITSYKKYKYYRQSALYMQAALWYLENILKINIKGWTCIPYIVTSQTTGHNECAVYQPSVSDIHKGNNENLIALEAMEWHFDNDQWDYPRSYYEEDGVVILNLDE